MHGDKECFFYDITNNGKVWKEDARKLGIYIYIKNKPPRKASTENLGTFTPTCCFSLIFISFINIYICNRVNMAAQSLPFRV